MEGAFDGMVFDDVLIVDAPAVAGANEFTLEIIIRPDPNALESEQKFLHIQEKDSKNRIILLVAKDKKGPPPGALFCFLKEREALL